MKKELLFSLWCLLFSAIAVFSYHKYIGALIFGPSIGDKKVIIFVTSWCPYCKKLKRQLDSLGVAYEEHDIESSKKSYFIYYSLGGGGVPISIVGDKVIYGYQPDFIQSEINTQKILTAIKNQ
ncbi:glutaredoxin family protein [Cellvibrio sp. KY-GH-1]|uniref:glutaredoxin domain-containing protein n=1 Tax=Cellvibrio sp. KY-GH-1 TaxID=2303332 RepID=UPI0012455ABD|nr:glutaredoxin domain-containing protein [Cellvibrio sp. KY-GH-1]QEY16802.1 glutaredoxin family protein [Cellvibrio sp. KY-GH-1]